MVNYERTKISEVKDLAKQGDQDALFEMVWRLNGLHDDPAYTSNDPVERCAWQDYFFEKAAEAGHIGARFRYAQSLVDRVIDAEYRNKAMNLFQSLVNDFDIGKLFSEDDKKRGIAAKMQLGMLLCEGYHTPRNVVEGVKLINEAEHLTNGFKDYGFESLYKLGRLYATGLTQPNEEPTSDDIKQAIKYLEAAIRRFNYEKGNPKELELAKQFLDNQGKRLLTKKKNEEDLAALTDILKEPFRQQLADDNKKRSDEERKKMLEMSDGARFRLEADKAAVVRLRQRLAQEGWESVVTISKGEQVKEQIAEKKYNSDFDKYIDALNEISNQKNRVELEEFYKRNSATFQFFNAVKAIDKYVQETLSKPILDDVVLKQLETALPMLTRLKTEITIIDSKNISVQYKNSIIQIVDYIKNKMSINEANDISNQLFDLLRKNEQAFIEEEKKRQEQECHEKKLQELKKARERIAKYQGCISSGNTHIVGLKTDGTIVVTGDADEHNQYAHWRNIIAISAKNDYTVGLKTEGMVIVMGGRNRMDKNGTNDWRDIVAVSAGILHIVGLKANGTVVAVGTNDYWNNKLGKYEYSGQCDIGEWHDIVAVSAGLFHTIGLKSDGSVVAIGSNKDFDGNYINQCNVNEWSNIVAVSVGETNTVGLKADGTVLSIGSNGYGQCNTQKWFDIIAVSAGSSHTVGLRANGTVIAVGNNDKGQCNTDDWCDVVAISAGNSHTIGLKADGTVIATGGNLDGQYNTGVLRNIGPVSEEQRLKWKQEEQRNEYNKLVQEKNKASDEDVFRGLAKQFRAMNGYENTEELARECDVAAMKLQYDQLVQAKNKASTEKVFLDLAKQFRSMNCYENTEELAKDCDNQYKVLKEKREQSERWEKQGLCRSCGGQIGGLFTKKCKVCGKPR